MNNIEWLPWNMSLFRGGFTTVRPSSILVKQSSQLEKFFTDPPWRQTEFPKNKLHCWSPALFPESGPKSKRANDNVLKISAIVFDYDHPGWSAERMAEHLSDLALAHCVYTTWSHTDEEPRYRVVVFLSRPVSPKEFTKVREEALALIGYTEGVDTGCSDIARLYAIPVRRTGSSFQSFLEVSSNPLCVDSLMSDTKETSGDSGASGLVLTASTTLILSEDGKDTASVGDLVALGKGKHKCACPFQEDASFGSAFLRVMNDGRAFLMCTSERHTHEKKQFWLRDAGGKKKKGKKRGSVAHSVTKRKELLEEIPEKLRFYIDSNIVFNAPQNVFYRRQQGAWQVGSPLRKDGIFNHLIGKLSDGLDGHHVNAMIDHILSRQVYGFSCDSSRGPTVYEDGLGAMLNLYARPEIRPLEGDFERVQKLISVLCDGDEKAIEWLMHWSASVVQHPERRSMVAVLCMSPQQGVGKSMFGRILSAAVGERNSAIVSNQALRDSFNASYVTKLLVLADEVTVAGSRDKDAVIPALKAYITDDRVPCRAPYAARAEVENRMTWWLTSNDRRPLIIEKDDRRFTVLVPGGCDWDYRRMLSGCFNPKTGKYSRSFALEVRAFAHHLHAMEVDYGLISRPYAAKARKLLQEASRGSVDHFVDLVAEVGAADAIADYPPGPEYIGISHNDVVTGRGVLPCELIYGSYRTWCERNGRRDIRPESTLRLAFIGVGDVRVQWIQLGGKKFQAYLNLPERKEETVVAMPGVDSGLS